MSDKVFEPATQPVDATNADNEGGIPGTIQLVDLKHELRVLESGDVILTPQPTTDPEDPLNWSRVRKLKAIVLSHMYVISKHASFFSMLGIVATEN